jgi:hypothetical protein
MTTCLSTIVVYYLSSSLTKVVVSRQSPSRSDYLAFCLQTTLNILFAKLLL